MEKEWMNEVEKGMESMGKWMNEKWMNKKTKEWRNEWMEKWMNGKMNEPKFLLVVFWQNVG